jgi:AcrR family transcriptional regulator
MKAVMAKGSSGKPEEPFVRLDNVMPPTNVPLNIELIVATAEDVIRRFGPAKATVVDVARALGVSHAAVYRHVATKAELRDLVVSRWIHTIMPPLCDIVASSEPAEVRLRKFIDGLMAAKRRRAIEDPELFTAYRTLAADARSVVDSHVDELVALVTTMIAAGVQEGTFHVADPEAAARAFLIATSRFHHPAHAEEWGDPALEGAYEELWRLLLNGLRTKTSAQPRLNCSGSWGLKG